MRYQVLIVDDEEIVCRGMAQFVKWEKSGFEVAGIATSVDEALRMLEKIPVDVIFSDIRMPEKSGIDLLKEVQEQYPDIQSVVLSGYSDFDYAREAIHYGAMEYLTKPVNLGEVEELLKRLSDNLDRRYREARTHTHHMEGLLLSIARGYTEADVGKYDLPKLESWYGISVFMTEKNLQQETVVKEKERIQKQIEAVIPDALILNSSVYALFAIVPIKGDEEFTHFVSMLEQVCNVDGCWGMGVSKKKQSISRLSEAFQETELAMRYLRADMRKKVIFYQNIEKLFSEKSFQIQEILTEFLCRLHGREDKRKIICWLEQALTMMEITEHMSVLEFQTVCIRFLIEINGHLQDTGLEKEHLHHRLNEVLQHILTCEHSQDVLHGMISYLDWVTQGLEQLDGQKISGGVIAEIQYFIQQHYQEDISLNMLAEQFYMHPNYLSRLFKEKTGENFVDYLVKVRMQKVKELLRNSDYKIVEICSMVGYDNPRSFSKAFRNHTGMRPKEYRESCQ